MIQPEPQEEEAAGQAGGETNADDLDGCPRCGLKIKEILWGHTDCPNCGLHFECC